MNPFARSHRLVRLPPLRASARRQVFFFTSVVVLTGLASWVLADILWRGGISGLEIAMLVLFVPLFGMVTLGFVQAVCGFFILLRRQDPFSISRTIPDELPQPETLPATAIAIPIYNEDVSRVYEGLRTIYLDLVRAGCIERFDFFILSDSNNPNKWIEEEVAWIDLCKQVKGFGRIFYRKRMVNLNRKSGNISDFLRRWGRKYRYMVVLDADSLMEAETLMRMVQLMEVNPRAGIIQTVPAPIQAQTFFARLMQFAGTLYGPIFQAGLNYWQAACGNFWGHNAIIRCAPFMEHCGLPTLTQGAGRARFMSHDYVEAALMRRADYEVWMAYELGGSYENLPPTPLDHACRDRRWCRGNLQHAWMLTAQGLHSVNRLHLLMGILSYAASPLWFLFLLLGMMQAWVEKSFGAGKSFDSDVGLSSFLDIGGGRLSLLLFGAAVTMLTLPKLLAACLVLKDKARRQAFGGGMRVVAGFAVEHALSVLLAPVQMIFNSRFVVEIMMGRDVPWNPQSRDVGGVDWEGIVTSYIPHTIVGLCWALLAWHIGPALFWWLSPVTFGLIISIPLCVVLSMPGLGLRLRRLKLFVIPAESNPPPVVSHLAKNLESIHQRLPPPPWLEEQFGLTQVVLDPYVSAAHCSLLRTKRVPGGAAHRYLRELSDRLLAQGPAALNRREQMVLLRNAQTVTDLHERVWHLPESQLSSWWRMAMRHYNTLTDRPLTALYR